MQLGIKKGMGRIFKTDKFFWMCWALGHYKYFGCNKCKYNW